MKHNIFYKGMALSLMLILMLTLTGTVMADDPGPNDAPPEEPTVEPEPPIDWGSPSRLASTVTPGVTPNNLEATVRPGESLEVEKTVTLPVIPPKLDLVLIVDLSGSYWDDLPNIKSKAPNIFTGIRASVSDSQFGLATFVDFPFYVWGDPYWGDYAYSLDQNLTTDQSTWLVAVNAMNTRNGYDEPESQYEALYQAATGMGREISGYTIPAGQNPDWRDGVTRVIAITTDASFHNSGDGGGPFPYPGASRDDTVAALNSQGIKVIAIKAPGSTTQMDDVANATGGAVTYTGSTSAEIVSAILGALEELTFTVTPVPVGCDPLQFTYSPSSHTGVMGGESVVFLETIMVPSDASGDIVCQVEFRADDTVIGIQDVTIHVNQPPVADPNGPYVFPLNAGPFDGTGSYDPDGDALTFDWDWGDGSISGNAGATPWHTYSGAGIYDVCLTVNDGFVDSDPVCTIAVIYDPSAGFVTGGGWIYSNPGSYFPDPDLEGKATFGFVSKYKKGASVPTGNTEFQFHAAGLNFHSEIYDWLVITGGNYARFKGVGTINGIGEYKFMLWAGDASPDTFRIKIWEEDEFGVETVVYDNGMDQAISSGSIVIHTK
jgi:hypothetical protein